LTAIWNLPLVGLSLVLAILGSYVALGHAQRMRASQGFTANVWMWTGAATLGVAIWSMHFIGMLAFQLPIAVRYDLLRTLASLLVAVGAALFGFARLRVSALGQWGLAWSALLIGFAIVGMHYLGMAAMRMEPPIGYPPLGIALALLFAAGASYLALRLLCEGTENEPGVVHRLRSALWMGLGIAAMHYTAMQGIVIAPNALCVAQGAFLDTGMLATMVSWMVLFWFGGGLLASLFDQRMARRNAQALAELERKHRDLMASAERHAEEMIRALRESEERLRMTLQNAPDAVFITEQDGRIVYVNDNVVNLLGYQRSELYAMNAFDLVPEDWRERYRETAKRIVSEQQRHVFEIRLVTKSGESIPMELNAVLLPNGRVYGSCRDIRERKAAEQALKKSQAQLQTFMDTIAEGMYGVDSAGRCTFVNKAFLRILGFDSAQELLGRNSHELFHYAHADGAPYPEHDCRVYQTFRVGQAVHAEDEVFWRKDGTPVPVEYWSQPVLEQGRVAGAVVTFLDISARKQSEREIHQLAFYDPLTRLPNRRLLMDRVQQALAVSARSGRYGALMLLDLDDFKKLNDSKGHDIGDLLLCEVARRLRGAVREGDTVARLGGDEFVVVLEELSANISEAAAQAERVAEKIRDVLNEPYLLQGSRHHSSPSIGLTLYRGHLEAIENLLKFADIAMYHSKRAGRNTISFYDPAMQATIDSRLELESELDTALQEQQFLLYYQVQVDALQRPLGAEVLLRWKHPRRGLVSPAEFIPLAEETGQIVAMGLWALQTACLQLKAWQQNALTRDLTLAVNVSAKQFRKADFVDQVRRVLLETGVRPSLLKLELTESTVLQDVEDAISKMRELKLMGISFSMDDFGTGYSSLQYLKRLPLDQIKIDQSFVRDITSDPNDAAIVQTIIAMTQALGLNVIAEGVETPEQQAFLEQRGCHHFQGYLFGKPCTIAAFEDFLERAADRHGTSRQGERMAGAG